MEDHRRNGWYWLGAAPLTAGAALAIGWLISVDAAQSPRPQYWAAPAFIAVGLMAFGALTILGVMNEWWPFGRQRETVAVAPKPAPKAAPAKTAVRAAVPAPATATAPAKSGDLIQKYGAPERQSELKKELLKELEKGMGLQQNLPGPLKVNFASFVLGAETTEADIIEWEDHVEFILKKHPRKLIRFKAKEKPNPMNILAPALLAFSSPLERELAHRLDTLERIVGEMD